MSLKGALQTTNPSTSIITSYSSNPNIVSETPEHILQTCTLDTDPPPPPKKKAPSEIKKHHRWKKPASRHEQLLLMMEFMKTASPLNLDGSAYVAECRSWIKFSGNWKLSENYLFTFAQLEFFWKCGISNCKEGHTILNMTNSVSKVQHPCINEVYLRMTKPEFMVTFIHVLGWWLTQRNRSPE